jgi:hypothetical protein
VTAWIIMSSVIEPATVWISRLGGPGREVEGTLSLTPTHLRFRHAKGSEHADIPLASVRKVQRPVGAGVLVVEWTGGAGMERVAFFFVQPPPVDDEGARMRRRRHRSESAGVMWQQTGRVVDTVKAWRRAVREAAREARA